MQNVHLRIDENSTVMCVWRIVCSLLAEGCIAIGNFIECIINFIVMINGIFIIVSKPF